MGGGANAKQMARAREARPVSLSLFRCTLLFQTLASLMSFSVTRALNFETDNAERVSHLLVPSKEVLCLSVCLSQTHPRLIPDLMFPIYSDLLFLFAHCFTLIISPGEQFGISAHTPGLAA